MSQLRVYPNPWAARDKDGTPCGLCPRDPTSDAGGPGRFVGARVDKARTEVLQDFGKNAVHELRSPMQRTKYEYMGVPADDPELAGKLAAKEPISIPATKYYKDRLAEGSLLAADAETARRGRVLGYVPASKVFEAMSPRPEPASAPETPSLPETADETTNSGEDAAEEQDQ